MVTKETIHKASWLYGITEGIKVFVFLREQNKCFFRQLPPESKVDDRHIKKPKFEIRILGKGDDHQVKKDSSC